jgi:isopenicillin N synthase-like dioxygenase
MTIGFFYGTLVFLCSRSGSNFISIAVRNHGISQDCLDEVLKVNQEYYSLSADEKMKVRHGLFYSSGSMRLTDANVL